MNHADILTPPVVDNVVTQLLERVLADARAGKVQGVGVIWSCGPQNCMTDIKGAFPCEINLGCDLLKVTIARVMTTPVSPIIRAHG